MPAVTYRSSVQVLSPYLARASLLGIAMQRIIRAVIIASTLMTSGCVTGQYGSRPAAWCGWQMRQEVMADPGPTFNRALAWKRYGVPAPGPEVGAIVVWSRGRGKGHVGKITGFDESTGQWIVRSGNDGHAVRERARSVKDALAFRRAF